MAYPLGCGTVDPPWTSYPNSTSRRGGRPGSCPCRDPAWIAWIASMAIPQSWDRCYADSRYADSRHAGCRYAGCRYAVVTRAAVMPSLRVGYRYAGCRYAGCRHAIVTCGLSLRGLRCLGRGWRNATHLTKRDQSRAAPQKRFEQCGRPSMGGGAWAAEHGRRSSVGGRAWAAEHALPNGPRAAPTSPQHPRAPPIVRAWYFAPG